MSFKAYLGGWLSVGGDICARGDDALADSHICDRRASRRVGCWLGVEKDLQTPERNHSVTLAG